MGKILLWILRWGITVLFLEIYQKLLINFEVIFVNDASTDDRFELLKI
jgi:glycosyltransferase involved in cell wall biosynthesis